MRESWRIHPDLAALDPVLEPTLGVLLFQEQVLEALGVLCGWSYAEADNVLNALRKKKHSELEKAKPAYLRDGVNNGFSEDGLNAFWSVLIPFSDYSFNMAHSAGYGLVSYWTAYLLANYPVKYMAALLSSVSDDPEKLHQYLEEAVRIGIDILPPDINVSGEGFTADGQGLRYGLASIKGVGKAATDAIISGRPYSSIYDFLLRVDGAAFNSGTLVALASVGTFDSLHMCRHHLVQWLETAHGESKAIRDNIGDGQYPLVSPREPSLLLSSDVRNRETALYQEWERSYLGVEVSTATVYVDVAGPLTYNDLTVVNETIRHHQGRSPVVVSFNGVELKDYGKVQYSEKLKNSLEAIPRIKVELR